MAIEQSADVSALFRTSVESAWRNQNIQASPTVREYIVGLLVDYVRPSPALQSAFDRPLTLALGDALHADPKERFDRLRTLGDGTLFLAGFFGPNLRRRGVEEQIVTTVGKVSYQSAAALLQLPSRARGVDNVLAELADKFRALVLLLVEVAETFWRQPAKHPSLARQVAENYERWAKTGSEDAVRASAAVGPWASSI